MTRDPASPTRVANRRQTRGNILCPQCVYNLQGLVGPLVTCPECGLCLDIRVFDTNWHRRKWHLTAAYGQIAAPTLFAGLAVLAVAMTSAVIDAWWLTPMMALNVWIVVLSCLAVGWLWLMAWVARRFRAQWALVAALGFHLVLAVYLASLPLGVLGMMMAIVSGFTGEWFAIGTLTIAGGVGVGVLVLARKAETWIGRRCLQHEALEQAKANTALTHLPES